jgi:microcin C transport system substrate-binding protein
MIYDTLTVASADEPFTRYGLLAESMEVAKDRSWIIFHLRKQARWHDGQPITAEDVVWTVNELTHNETVAPFYRFYYVDVDTVQALDPHTVKFSFKPTGNREVALTVGEIPILPKHYWTEAGKNRNLGKSTLEPPLGSGPYKIGKFETGRYIAYDRVSDYWGQDINVNIGLHNFDQQRVEYFRDGNVAVEGFKGGAYDFRNENMSKVWATGYDMPAVKNGQIVKEAIPQHRTAPMQGYGFNSRRDLFKDPKVREALAYAFDFEWSNQNLFYGQYKRTRSYFGNSVLEAKGLPEGEELQILETYRDQLPREVFTKEYNPPATNGDGRIRPNLKEADRLLKEAGWEIVGKDRVHTATGQKLEFEIMLVQPAFERITLPFKKHLSRLGITANVRTVDTAQYIKRMETYDFDMVVVSWGQSLSPGGEQWEYWGSEAADTLGGRNYLGIKNPVVDDLIKLIISAPDRTSLEHRTRALDRVLQWGHYIIPQWYADYDRVLYWNKYSRPEVTLPYGFLTARWWYDEAKARALNPVE